ncbi:MAG: GTPase-associated system all-helical protein GASH [Bacteroidia bacterium]
MNTAKSLFTDWYNNSLKKDAGVSELQPKRDVINKLLKEKDIKFWVNIIRVYLGKVNSKDKIFNDFALRFKEEDEFFSLTNENITRVLAGCVLAERIEYEEDSLSDLIILLLIINSDVDMQVLPEIINRAEIAYINSCEEKRKIKLEPIPGKFKPSVAKSSVVSDDKIGNQVSGLVKDNHLNISAINLIIEYIEQMGKNFKSLSEENNMLWWIFSSHSSILGKPTKLINEGLNALICALELANLTEMLPGAGDIDSLIEKSLEFTENYNVPHKTLVEIISSIKGHENDIRKHLPDLSEEFADSLPVLYGVIKFTELSEQEWQPQFLRKTALKDTVTISLLSYSSRLYKEIMAAKIINILSV